ncbi:MAG: SRPBCC domain-containing protein [Gammaproteobacteria bacterium]|nr:SRPBCC domain-containing protein [Gammaproteobacteria bacterium]
MHAESASETAAREIVIERVFDAPLELVWEAWTDPEHVRQWWGPQGFHNESCAADLREGGVFRLAMRAPDGNVYPCVGTFREIVPFERIVYEGEAADGHPCGAGIPPHATVTVRFAEEHGKTRLTLHTRFASAKHKLAAAEARFVVSWKEALERLDDLLMQH